MGIFCLVWIRLDIQSKFIAFFIFLLNLKLNIQNFTFGLFVAFIASFVKMLCMFLGCQFFLLCLGTPQKIYYPRQHLNLLQLYGSPKYQTYWIYSTYVAFDFGPQMADLAHRVMVKLLKWAKDFSQFFNVIIEKRHSVVCKSSNLWKDLVLLITRMT